MSSVVDVVVNLFDHKKLELDVARTIIASCRKGVHWCDGNEYEAVEGIRRCRCGKCLQKIPKGEYLYSLYDLPYDIREKYNFMKGRSIVLASDGLCSNCFDEVFNEFCKDETAGEQQRKFIMQNYEEKDYISEGEHRYFF